ncbi:hypothetical protein ABT368_24845 [Streptomyces althioticus]|uniref:hypothetical protein n=1 Tax=Streptomyces TaxID=1883 RepID=UPI001876466F|nr:hypothetical protein [Streptomyces lusitanus]GGT78111.1 hypothetical protein GCM10010243_65810 [Streptomyces matensis]
MRRDLRARAEDSRSRAPFYAFALYPKGFDSAVALLEADLLRPDETVPRITLDWLTETFSADDFGGPKVTRTEASAGPAARIRQNLAMSGSSDVDAGVLLETFTYGVLPTGSKAAVMLLGSGSVPGLTEEMEEAVDSIAVTLTVESLSQEMFPSRRRRAPQGCCGGLGPGARVGLHCLGEAPLPQAPPGDECRSAYMCTSLRDSSVPTRS